MAGPNKSASMTFTSRSDLSRLALAFRNGFQQTRTGLVDRVLGEVSFIEPPRDSSPFGQFEKDRPDFSVVAVSIRHKTQAQLQLDVWQSAGQLRGQITRRWRSGLDGNTKKLSVSLLESALREIRTVDPSFSASKEVED